jgi:hypothetical protein
MTVEVMLGFFSPRRKPSFMYEGIVLWMVDECEYCILREEIVRERRGSYNKCVVGCIPSFVG